MIFVTMSRIRMIITSGQCANLVNRPRGVKGLLLSLFPCPSKSSPWLVSRSALIPSRPIWKCSCNWILSTRVLMRRSVRTPTYPMIWIWRKVHTYRNVRRILLKTSQDKNRQNGPFLKKFLLTVSSFPLFLSCLKLQGLNQSILIPAL